MPQSFIDHNDDSILAMSPTMSTKVSSVGESPRPIKRARKAINCEPCRTSKLKCDRGRPCSGCLLRGTSSNCYVDSTSNSAFDRKPVPSRNASLDPVAEIARIRNSLNALEQCLSDCSGDLPADSSENADGKSLPESMVTPPRGTKRPGVPWDEDDLEGPTLGLGPFSNSLGYLYRRDVAAVPWAIDKPEQATQPSYSSQYFLSDLVQSIPENLEERVTHYSEASRRPFYAIRKDVLFDDLKKVTRCPIILARAFLLLSLSCSGGESRRYLRLSDQAKERLGRSANTPSLPILELYLLRIQLLEKLGEEEEIWSLRARVLAIALALDLHRDTKGSLRSDELERERRRLAWLSCLWVDRWYAILLRRSPSIHPSLYDAKRPRCLKQTDQAYLNSEISFLELLWPILRDMFMVDSPTEPVELDRHNELLGKLLQQLPVIEVDLRARILYTRLAIYRLVLQDNMDITSLHAAVAIARDIEKILCENASAARAMSLLAFNTAYFLSEILIQDPPSCVSYRPAMRQSIHSILNSDLFFRETPQYQLLNTIKPLWDEGSNLLLPAARVAVWEQAKKDVTAASIFDALKGDMESVFTPTALSTSSFTSQSRRDTISSNDPPSPLDSDAIRPSSTSLPNDAFDCVVPMGINPSMTLLPFQFWEPLQHKGCLDGATTTPFVSGIPILGEQWIYECFDRKSEGFNSTLCKD